MLKATVVGNVWATKRVEGLPNGAFLEVEVDGGGHTLVAFDVLGSGVAKNLKPLDGFYHTLAGIYRFKYGQSQLEFLWDGQSHYEKYQRDWTTIFNQWISEFCHHEQFAQAVLDLSVFLPDNRNAQLAENRMHFVMLQFFDLKIHKSRGIVEMKVA